MAPKTIFSCVDVIQAAFSLVKESGFKDFTARRIAEKLGSSTAPVYSYFKSMDELKREVLLRAEHLALEYTKRPYTRSIFLNMGTGLVMFAQENKELFKALILESPEAKQLLEEFADILYAELDKDELLSLLPAKNRREILIRMGMFTHGLASLISAGIYKDLSKKEIINIMYNMGKDVIDVALIKAGIKKNFTA